MSNTLRLKLINYVAQKKASNSSGFTLVELIVVVVIIGILSAIAIPSFNNASDKAKQKEASTLLASYAKAAQAFYTENSLVARTVSDLNGYITVAACGADVAITECKDNQVAVSGDSTQWRSPTGMYNIVMTRNDSQTGFTATPTWNGYPVASVFCTSTGSTILNEGTIKRDSNGAPRVPTCPSPQ